ncbi:MAG: hypothetical protein JNM63_14020 [Spirochaetia bacterium]|nr:hypothetical protein [Spirochaetia bacterium]
MSDRTDQADKSMTSLMLALLASYAGPLHPGLENLLKGGLFQREDSHFLSGLHPSEGKQLPLEAQKNIPFKSRLEYLANEVIIAEHIGKVALLGILVQGLVFTHELKTMLAPLGVFSICLSWDFREHATVTFYKVRDGESWAKPETAAGLTTLEIRT